jgi:hypothetical protein
VGSGRQRVPTVGGAGAAGLPERRLVGSGRQCVQAAACAVPTELRGRTILECGFQRLSAAWPGLGDGRRQVTTLGFSRLTPRSSSARSGGAGTGVRSSRQRSAWVIAVYSHSQDRRLETPPIDRANCDSSSESLCVSATLTAWRRNWLKERGVRTSVGHPPLVRGRESSWGTTYIQNAVVYRNPPYLIPSYSRLEPHVLSGVGRLRRTAGR